MAMLEIYRESLTTLNKDVKDLQALGEDIKSKIASLSPYQAGDLVRVKTRRHGSTPELDVYINSVSVDKNGKWVYKYNKPKKDGSQGGISFNNYYALEILGFVADLKALEV